MASQGTNLPTPALIRARFPEDAYVAFHAPRFAVLLEMLARRGVHHVNRILDIGNSPLTALLAAVSGRPVDNLGLDGDFDTPYGHSYWYDLNLTSSREKWRTDLPSYDLIVLAEVIEHLYTAPQTVLAFLRSLLTDRGVIAVQTPNAVVIHNRIQMLVGRNPFELIREEVDNPGHFREYTGRELRGACSLARLEVVHWSAHAYFDYRFFRASPTIARVGDWLNLFYRSMPPSLRPGQTLLARASTRTGSSRHATP